MLFRRNWLLSKEALYELGQSDALIQAISETPIQPEYYQRLKTVSLIKGAQATTAIEGNTLTEDEIRQVADGLSLAPSKEYQEIEVRNILDAMNELLDEVTRGSTGLISPDLIRRFHTMVGKDLGEHFDAIPGRFRQDERIVGSYRCPSYTDVPELVEHLCEWLRGDFHFSRGNQPFTDAVVQAIVAHVYLEWIHPFGDGNGRTGRLLEFYILLRAGLPDISSHILSNFYNATRPEYYRQLELANRKRSLSSFIDYAIKGLRDGLVATLRTIQTSQFATAWRSFIYEKFAVRPYTKKTAFKRRRELMLAIPTNRPVTLQEIIVLTPELARAYARVSERTVRRDIDVLIEMELVGPVGRNQFEAKVESLRQHMAQRLDHEPVGQSAVVGT